MLQRGNVMAMKVSGLTQRGVIAMSVVASILLPLSPAWSQPQGSPDNGGGQSPGGPGPGRGFGGGGGGGRHMGGHSLKKAVDQLTDLTPKQKSDVDALFQSEKESLAPIMQQAQAAKAAGGGASAGGAGGGAAAGGPGAGGAGGAGASGGGFRAQIMAKRKETWEKLKTILTPQQMDELKTIQANSGGGPGGGGPGRFGGGGPGAGGGKPPSGEE
jgi:Spy/CpxP family protein refolding chaperone